MLQILAYIPLTNLLLPANFEIFLTNYLSVSKIAIPFALLPEWVSRPPDLVSDFATPPLNERFESGGLETVSFVYNFSEQLLTWAITIVAYLALVLCDLILPSNRPG